VISTLADRERTLRKPSFLKRKRKQKKEMKEKDADTPRHESQKKKFRLL
jgi:hypothetical protein